MFGSKRPERVFLMSCEENIAISIKNIGKTYQVYEKPIDRLKQTIFGNLSRLLGLPGKKYFKNFNSLKSISFDIKKGETVGLIGRNGSGKSTLLQIICGTLHPSYGAVEANGRIAALLELGSGFNPEFTGKENIYLNGSILGLQKKQIDEVYNQIVDFADIGDFLNQPVKTYSSGMAVRLAFAVAVSVQPDILVVDEALAVGDESFQRKCFARIEAIKKAGGTILFVTHSTQLVLELCDRAAFLKDGELMYVGDTKKAVDIYYKSIKSSAVFDIKLEADNEKSVDAFDFSLASLNSHQVYNQQYGIKINQVRILNSLDEIINILKFCEKYKIVVDASSSISRDYSFQVLFKTINGIPIAGNKIKCSTANGDFSIEYEFDCLINPGVYFISVEITGIVNGEEVIFHKMAEIIAFRVIGTTLGISFGYCSLNPKMSNGVIQ